MTCPAPTPSPVAAVFDRAAATYDAVGVEWFRPIAAGLVRALDVKVGERVLDIGCGRGAALIPLAAAAGPSGKVLGIDLAPAMVELTARDVAHLPQVAVRVADAAAPGLPAGSFDVIASSLVLFFLPDPAAAVRIWSDLLAPGGRLGVTTFGQQDERWQRIDELFSPYLPTQLRDARTTGRRGPFDSDAGVEDLLTQAGLGDVQTITGSVEAVFSSPAQLLEFTWSHGQRAMWEAVPEPDRPALAAQIEALAGRLQGDARQLRLTQSVRYTLATRSSSSALQKMTLAGPRGSDRPEAEQEQP